MQSSPFFSLQAVHPRRIREDGREIAGDAHQSRNANFNKKGRTLFLLLKVSSRNKVRLFDLRRNFEILRARSSPFPETASLDCRYLRQSSPLLADDLSTALDIHERLACCNDRLNAQPQAGTDRKRLRAINTGHGESWFDGFQLTTDLSKALVELPRLVGQE
ncbi:hypothetical protein [Achromobacter sp. Root565]|uniref:hypothetical protein n=1 Tax=Achromobacter sp. Root565 TaxID=1736564 RepID=UPI0012E3C5C3|nr:hypothetical protein [Achromobacter sp. Root565]